MMFVSVDTGIGSGLVLSGELYTGGAGMADEIGHVKVIRDGPPCTCGARGLWHPF
jgi:glucokinase